MSRTQNLESWALDTQPGWELYSSQESEASMVPCSLEVPVTQRTVPRPTTPINTAPILVPETPEMSRIERITAMLEEERYTTFVHKLRDGREMHLAFRIYDA